jgi:hypothetical protein
MWFAALQRLAIHFHAFDQANGPIDDLDHSPLLGIALVSAPGGGSFPGTAGCPRRHRTSTLLSNTFSSQSITTRSHEVSASLVSASAKRAATLRGPASAPM